MRVAKEKIIIKCLTRGVDVRVGAQQRLVFRLVARLVVVAVYCK